MKERKIIMKILLIIPAYNEQDNILKTYNSIIEYNVKFKSHYDVMVINDGSTDNTENICNENNIPHISLIHNLGIGGAVQTGYKYAKEKNYDIAIQFDGDGQHNINYVKDLIKPIIDLNADFVIGSRFVGNLSKFKSTKSRQFGIKIISFLINFFTGKKIYDPTSGFRAANREIIKIFANSYPFEYPEPSSIVTLIKNKFKIVEIPVEMSERQGGKSSIIKWKVIYYMLNVSLFIFINSIKKRSVK